jgi:hypothetical protein
MFDINEALKPQNGSDIVILSEAKLQRSGRSPRGQAFNLGLFLPSALSS